MYRFDVRTIILTDTLMSLVLVNPGRPVQTQLKNRWLGRKESNHTIKLRYNLCEAQCNNFGENEPTLPNHHIRGPKGGGGGSQLPCSIRTMH